MIGKHLNRFSRAGKFGTLIKCPDCPSSTIIYHMAWSAITCGHCQGMIEKRRWRKISHYKTPHLA